ncbi:MAG: fructose-bisphosphate aldolase [Anaerolineae bacterium]|nr:fructose-bisphosphate aldolase [Anaerolineae bacterium]
MLLGKQVRLNRLFNRKSGNILVIALDHAIGWGILPGIDDISRTMEKIVEAEPDAVTMLKGTAENVFSPFAGTIPLIMKSTTFAPYHPHYDTLVGEVDDAVRLGADAIAVGATLCGDHQAELLRQLASVVHEASVVGLPTVAHIYPKGVGEKAQYKAEHVSYAARAASELGVDIVKTYYTGDPESYKQVVRCCTSRLVVSGGPRLPSVRDVFQMTHDAIKIGARGVTYGRNVWQADSPGLMVTALKHIIHNQGTVDEAMEIVQQS